MPNILEVMEVLRIAVIKAMRIEIWKEYGLIKFNVLPSIPNPITIWKNTILQVRFKHPFHDDQQFLLLLQNNLIFYKEIKIN